MAEDDPRALFQEQVPLSFLEFQKAIKKEVATRAVTGNPPVMMEEEFRYEAVWLCVCACVYVYVYVCLCMCMCIT